MNVNESTKLFSVNQLAHKRKRVEDEEPDNSVKKSKIDSGFTLLPIELVTEILSYFNFKDLLVFERVSKSWKELTKPAWSDLVKNDRNAFRWMMCEKTENPAKWNYCLSKAIYHYIIHHSGIFQSRNFCMPAVKKGNIVFGQFEGLMERFPYLKYYLYLDIAPYLFGSRSIAKIRKLHEKISDKLVQGIKEQSPGETLLKGLIEIKQLHERISSNHSTFDNRTIIDRAWSYISVAKQKGVNCANQLAIHACPITECVERTQEEFQNGSLLADAGLIQTKLEEWEKADYHYSNSIIAFGGQSIPPNICADAGDTKLKLNKPKEADFLYTQAINAYGNDIPAEVLAKAGHAKLLLKQYPAADALYTRAINAYGNDIPAEVLAKAGHAKLLLEQYPAADALYTRAINAYGNQEIPAEVLGRVLKL